MHSVGQQQHLRKPFLIENLKDLYRRDKAIIKIVREKFDFIDKEKQKLARKPFTVLLLHWKMLAIAAKSFIFNFFSENIPQFRNRVL